MVINGDIIDKHLYNGSLASHNLSLWKVRNPSPLPPGPSLTRGRLPVTVSPYSQLVQIANNTMDFQIFVAKPTTFTGTPLHAGLDVFILILA